MPQLDKVLSVFHPETERRGASGEGARGRGRLGFSSQVSNANFPKNPHKTRALCGVPDAAPTLQSRNHLPPPLPRRRPKRKAAVTSPPLPSSLLDSLSAFTWAFEERSGRRHFREGEARDHHSAFSLEFAANCELPTVRVRKARRATTTPPISTTRSSSSLSTPSAAAAAPAPAISPSIHPVAASTRRAEKAEVAAEFRAFLPAEDDDECCVSPHTTTSTDVPTSSSSSSDSRDAADAHEEAAAATGIMVEPQPDAPPHVSRINGGTTSTSTSTPEQDAVMSEMNGDANNEKPAKDGAESEDHKANGLIHTSNTNGVTPSPPPTSTATSTTVATTTPLPIQAALAQLVPKEVAQYAPLLVGKYYVQDKRAVWAGRWGMTEAAFGGNGVTSAFEMKSDEDVYIRTASGGADIVHPVFTGAALAKSSAMETAPVDAVNPAYIGYEADASVRSALPFDCKYSGFFQIQAVKGKPQTVTEKSVEIRFVHDASRPSQFYVSGTGENRFGVFSLVGLLDKETSELRLYKIYKPKQPEKRVPPPKRTRAAAAASKPPAPVPKVQTKAAPIVNAPAVQVTPPATKTAIAPPPPAPVAAPSIPAPAPAPVLSVKRPLVTTPMGSEGSAASPFVVGRGQRKRVMPAHLRDENVLDHDQASPVLKKCHAILKGLMANPKAGPFLMPVDPIALGIPNYFDVIKEPMDLGTIRHNLEGGFYDDVSVFIDHVRLVFENAMLYNAAHSQVHIFAAKLAEDFEKRIKNLNAKQAKERLLERSSSLLSTSSSSVFKIKRDRKGGEPTHSTKKIKGGRGAKGNSKRAPADDNQLIMSLKEDIERLKATLEQLQPVVRVVTPKPSKAASRPFKMEDLTEEELNEPMTQADKARLSEDIRQLPQEKINRVLQIIAESVPVSKLTNENDEVEIDINSFDTRCLRMLEGYVRENGIGRKRKRPTLTKKSGKSAPVSHRLKSAKVAAVNIRQRQEQLKNQLAMIDGNGQVVTAVPAAAAAAVPDVEMAKPDDSSSDSSSSSSDSSDSDSDSDSESDSDGAAPLQRSPVLSGGASLSQLSDSARADAAKKIRDEMSSREPLKVENRGAWSLLAQKEATSDQSLLPADENPTSSLWMSARSMEQVKQQKIQQKEKERSDELEAQRRRDAEQREKDKEEAERRKQEKEASHREAHEERVRQERAREAEKARAAHRAVEREKLLQDEDLDEHHEHTLTEDLESFSSSSFL